MVIPELFGDNRENQNNDTKKAIWGVDGFMFALSFDLDDVFGRAGHVVCPTENWDRMTAGQPAGYLYWSRRIDLLRLHFGNFVLVNSDWAMVVTDWLTLCMPQTPGRRCARL